MDVVRARIKDVRTRQGLSGATIARRMSELGFSWSRDVVGHIETGRRTSVTVDELMALAVVLDVSPLVLLLPETPECPLAPRLRADGQQVYRWVIGRGRRPGTVGAHAPSTPTPSTKDDDRAWPAFRELVPWLEPDPPDPRVDQLVQHAQRLHSLIDELATFALKAAPQDHPHVLRAVELLHREPLGTQPRERRNRE